MYYDQIDWASLGPEDIRKLTGDEARWYYDWMILYIGETYATHDVLGLTSALEAFTNARLARLEPTTEQTVQLAQLMLTIISDHVMDHSNMEDVLIILSFCLNSREPIPIELDWKQMWAILSVLVLQDTPCSVSPETESVAYFDLIRMASIYFKIEDIPEAYALARRNMNVRSRSGQMATLIYSHFIPRTHSLYTVQKFHERQRQRFENRASHPEYEPYLLPDRPKTCGEYLLPMMQSILGDAIGLVQFNGLSRAADVSGLSRILYNLVCTPYLTWTREQVESVLGWIQDRYSTMLHAWPQNEAITGGPEDTIAANAASTSSECIWQCWQVHTPPWSHGYSESCLSAFWFVIILMLGRFRLGPDGELEDHFPERDVAPDEDITYNALRRIFEVVSTFIRKASHSHVPQLHKAISFAAQLAVDIPQRYILCDPLIDAERKQAIYSEYTHGRQFIESFGVSAGPVRNSLIPQETLRVIAGELAGILLQTTRIELVDFKSCGIALKECLMICPEALLTTVRSLVRAIAQGGRKCLMMNSLCALSVVVHALIEAQGRGVVLVDTERGGVVLPVTLLAEVVEQCVPYISTQHSTRLSYCCMILRTIIFRCPLWDPTNPEDEAFCDAWTKLLQEQSGSAQSPSQNFCPDLVDRNNSELEAAVAAAAKVEGHMADTVLANIEPPCSEQLELLRFSSPWPQHTPCPPRYTPELHKIWCDSMHRLCVAICDSMDALIHCCVETSLQRHESDWKDLSIGSFALNDDQPKTFFYVQREMMSQMPPPRSRHYIQTLFNTVVTEEHIGVGSIILSILRHLGGFAPLVFFELVEPLLHNIFEDDERTQMRPLTLHLARQIQFLAHVVPVIALSDYPVDADSLTPQQRIQFLFSGYEPTTENLTRIQKLRHQVADVFERMWRVALSCDDPASYIFVTSVCSVLGGIHVFFNRTDRPADAYQFPVHVYSSRALLTHGWRAWAALPGCPIFLDEQSIAEAEAVHYKGLSIVMDGPNAGVDNTPEGLKYRERMLAQVGSPSERAHAMCFDFVKPPRFTPFLLRFLPPAELLRLNGAESVSFVRNVAAVLRRLTSISQLRCYRVSEAELVAAALKLHEEHMTVDGMPPLKLLRGPVAGAGLPVPEPHEYPLPRPNDSFPMLPLTSEIRLPLLCQLRPGAPIICMPTLASRNSQTVTGGPREWRALRYVNAHKTLIMDDPDCELYPPGPMAPTPDVSSISHFEHPAQLSYNVLLEPDEFPAEGDEFTVEDALEIIKCYRDEGCLQREINQLVLANITAVITQQPNSIAIQALIKAISPFEVSGQPKNDRSEAASPITCFTHDTPYTVFRSQCSRSIVAIRALLLQSNRGFLSRRSMAFSQSQAECMRLLLHISLQDYQMIVREKAVVSTNNLIGNAPSVVTQVVSLCHHKMEYLPYTHPEEVSSARYDDNLATTIRAIDSMMDFMPIVGSTNLDIWRRLLSALRVTDMISCAKITANHFKNFYTVMSMCRPIQAQSPAPMLPHIIAYQESTPIFEHKVHVSPLIADTWPQFLQSIETLSHDLDFYRNPETTRRSSMAWAKICATFVPIFLSSIYGGLSAGICKTGIQHLIQPIQELRDPTVEVMRRDLSLCSPVSTALPATQLPRPILDLLSRLSREPGLTEAAMWEQLAALGTCSALSVEECDVETEEMVLASSFNHPDELYVRIRHQSNQKSILYGAMDPDPSGRWLTTEAITPELHFMMWNFPYEIIRTKLPNEIHMGSIVAHQRPPLDQVRVPAPDGEGMRRTWLLGKIFNDEAQYPSTVIKSEELADIIYEELDGTPIYHSIASKDYSFFAPQSPSTREPVLSASEPVQEQLSDTAGIEIRDLAQKISGELAEKRRGAFIQLLELFADDSMNMSGDDNETHYKTGNGDIWRRIVILGGPRALDRLLCAVAPLAESHHIGHQRALSEVFVGAIRGIRKWAAVEQARFRGRLVQLLETALFTGFSDPQRDWCPAITLIYTHQDPRQLAWLSTAICRFNIRALTDETLPIAVRMRASAVECLIPLGTAGLAFCRPLIECLLERRNLAHPITSLRAQRVSNMLLLFLQSLRTQPPGNDGAGIGAGEWLEHPLFQRIIDMLRNTLHIWTNIDVRRRATEREHQHSSGSARPPVDSNENGEPSDADEEARLLETVVEIINRMIGLGLSEILMPQLIDMLPDLILMVRHPKAQLRFPVQHALEEFSHIVLPCADANHAMRTLLEITRNGYVVPPTTRLGWLMRGAAVSCMSQLAFCNSHCVNVLYTAHQIVDIVQDASRDQTDPHASVFLIRCSSCLSLLLKALTPAQCEELLPNDPTIASVTRCIIASAIVLSRPAVITPLQVRSLRILTECYSPSIDSSTGALVRDTINSWWALHEASWTSDRAILGEELASDVLPLLADFSAFT